VGWGVGGWCVGGVGASAACPLIRFVRSGHAVHILLVGCLTFLADGVDGVVLWLPVEWDLRFSQGDVRVRVHAAELLTPLLARVSVSHIPPLIVLASGRWSIRRRDSPMN